MTHLEFIKDKYGFELLMDLYQFEKNPKLFFIPDFHKTDFYEIMFFKTGKGQIEVQDTLVDVCVNSVFFFSPGQAKRCFVNKSSVQGFHLVFQNAFLGNFFSDKLFTYRLQYFHNFSHPFYLQLDEGVYHFLSNLLMELLMEIKSYQKDSEHLLRSLLYYVLVRLNRAYSLQNDISNRVAGNNKAYEFKKLLEEHITKFNRVNDYATLMGISRVYLNKLIKKQFGISISEMIADRLLLEIKSQLIHTSSDISEIAYRLNFSEANNLSRFFKSHTGVSPKSYRLSYQYDRSSI